MGRTTIVSMLAFFDRQACTVAKSPFSAAGPRSIVAFARVTWERSKVAQNESVRRETLQALRTSFTKRNGSAQLLWLSLFSWWNRVVPTASAAVTTARTQARASGVEQCFAMSSASLCVIPKNSRASPPQSSGRSSKSWMVAASWAMNTFRAQVKTATRAANGAQRKNGSKWYARKDNDVAGNGTSEAEREAQWPRAENTSALGSLSTEI